MSRSPTMAPRRELSSLDRACGFILLAPFLIAAWVCSAF